MIFHSNLYELDSIGNIILITNQGYILLKPIELGSIDNIIFTTNKCDILLKPNDYELGSIDDIVCIHYVLTSLLGVEGSLILGNKVKYEQSLG